MLKRFENDQVVAAAEKEFKQAQEIEAAFVRDSEKLLGVGTENINGSNRQHRSFPNHIN
jgi:hypothetical protein